LRRGGGDALNVGSGDRADGMRKCKMGTSRRVGLAACCAALLAGPALAATGADVHAAEKAVGERLGKGARRFFPTAFETRTAVCGVVTTDDGDARFVVELAVGAGGKRTTGAVLIDGLSAPANAAAPAPSFEAVWSADCA
jgi:hypothetical protein